MRNMKRSFSVLLLVCFMVLNVCPVRVVRAEEKMAPVNYIFVDKPCIETGDVQHVAVSLSAMEGDIENAVLKYKDSDGEEHEMACVTVEEDIIGFEQTFYEEDTGTYVISKMGYTVGGTKKEIVFSDYGIDAFFDVNQACNDETASIPAMENNEEVSSENITEKVEEALAQNSLTAYGDSAADTLAVNDRNVIVVLDPGHCDLHSGAYQNGIAEHVPLLKIAQYCKAELETYANVTVYLTRNSAACPFPNSGGAIRDIYERVDWAARKGADIFVSFHLDSAGSTATGAHVFYPSSDYANANIVNAGGQLAQKILNQLVNLGLYNRGAKPWDFAVNTRAAKNGFPGVLIEHCFLSNPNDVAKYLSSDAKLKILGQADANGIANYLGLRRKSVQTEQITINPVDPSTAKTNLFGTHAIDITGKNRSLTSMLLADNVKKSLGIKKFNTVILADGRNYPDGLAASQLSSKLYAPVLLVTPATEDTVRQYIFNNLAIGGNILVAGGDGVIANTFVARLKSFGTVQRFAGADRYKTNMLILQEMVKNLGEYDELIVVSGADFPDALSVTATGRPIMLVRDPLNSEQQAFLKNGGFSKITIVGGEGVVSSNIENDIYSTAGIMPKRLGGINRIETSRMVAQEYFQGYDCAVYTKADVFADGLSAGLLANTLGSPLLLTYNKSDRVPLQTVVTVGGVEKN